MRITPTDHPLLSAPDPAFGDPYHLADTRLNFSSPASTVKYAIMSDATLNVVVALRFA